MTDINYGDQGSPAGGNQEPGSGLNPAWNELLGKVPQELHSQIIPDLQKWDQGFNSKLSEVQSKYKPYDEFVSGGVAPDQIQEALSVVQALRANPEMVWKQLGEKFGYGQQPQGQPQGQGQQSDEIWGDLSPELQQRLQTLIEEQNTLREVAGTMAQILVGQQQESQSSKEDRELEEMYTGLMQDPVFNSLNAKGEAEPYINSLLQADLTPEQALQKFHGFVEHVLKTAGRAPAPRVLGAGGAIPSSNIDIRKATPMQARQLVANMIADAAAAAE